uniref:Tripartite motif-containing protein 2-like n=1 Tax=Crassostrea virginica TaxID=6565 RepID=A0A8B8B379_CRAVI|nr:tripartite motif-containing protein 2-like [Crassostrea virginica]
MDPQHSAQDVLRCDLCDTPVPPMYCDICHIKLCVQCVGVHLSDRSNEHKVVPFEERGSSTKCPKHPTKICDLHCEECDVPICSECVSSGEHLGHKPVKIKQILTSRKEIIKEDLQEIEKYIYPKYQEAVSNIPTQKANARKHTQKLTTDLKKQGETLHKEIDTVIKIMQSEIDDMDSKHLDVINRQEDAINKTIAAIEQTIINLKKLLETSDVCLLSEYVSRNEEFRKLPSQFQVTLPTFTPEEMDREQILQQLGSLSKLAIITEEHSTQAKTSGAEFPPYVLQSIETSYGKDNGLHNVSCLNDRDLWTQGRDKILRLYNTFGHLKESIQTKSGNKPWDMAVTTNGELVYTDYRDKSINIVKDAKIKSLIRLHGWGPLYLCSTSSGDLLVIMITDDGKQTRVVRYAKSKENQIIQRDGQDQPLFSSNLCTKYLCENRNFDICVADFIACAVVVVNASGELRFRYTGNPSTGKNPFLPWGITTDRQSRILTSDGNNHCIHILDQDGHFLRYIDNCGLKYPAGLCVDSRDNVFVAEFKTGIVKKIVCCK